MNFDLSIDRESPFQPGKPVSPYYFEGRHSSIQKILRYYLMLATWMCNISF